MGVSGPVTCSKLPLGITPGYVQQAGCLLSVQQAFLLFLYLQTAFIPFPITGCDRRVLPTSCVARAPYLLPTRHASWVCWRRTMKMGHSSKAG